MRVIDARESLTPQGVRKASYNRLPFSFSSLFGGQFLGSIAELTE